MNNFQVNLLSKESFRFSNLKNFSTFRQLLPRHRQHTCWKTTELFSSRKCFHLHEYRHFHYYIFVELCLINLVKYMKINQTILKCAKEQPNNENSFDVFNHS